MIYRKQGGGKDPAAATSDFSQAVHTLLEKALKDARSQLHPLMWDTDVYRLRQRSEFVQTFKRALEQGIAQNLASWQRGVLAVYQFDESLESRRHWDGSIHLLVKVPHLLNSVRSLGKNLDRSLVKYLKQLGWSRFQKRQSVLEIQQVTVDELRRGIGFGAMFHAVHSVPVKVWPIRLGLAGDSPASGENRPNRIHDQKRI